MLFELFYSVMRMNCIATIVSALVLTIKYILQKTGLPRRLTILLWLIIGFRLICPSAISTDLSVFNLIYTQNSVPQQTVISVQADALSENSYIYSDFEIKPYDKFEKLKTGAAIVWLAGVAGILLFGIISYLSLKRQLRFAAKLRDNIYTTDNIPGSFVFGIFSPKIYIPEAVTDSDMQFIIAHEQAHIKRVDHIVKIVAYILLAVHWFNPLNWIMFKLFSSDIEFACDECAVLKIGLENKKAYLNTLLSAAIINKEKKVLLYSVCFSSSLAKMRIKNMLTFRKCPKFITLIGLGTCILAFILFGTNAKGRINESKTVMSDSSAAELTAAAKTDTENNIPENSKPSPLPSEATEKPAENIHRQNEMSSPSHIEATAAVQKKQTSDNALMGMGKRNVDVSNIKQELKDSRAAISENETLVSDENYAAIPYSYENGCNNTVSNVRCNEDGELSICFSLNTESYVNVTVIDSETKNEIEAVGILADNKSTYTFSGLDNTKTYDLAVAGGTGDEWKVEGQYIVY